MQFYYGYHFWGMHLVWWIIWIILIIWVYTVLIKAAQEGIKKESPLDILQRKYAKGEISTEEYEERKAVLKKDGVQ